MAVEEASSVLNVGSFPEAVSYFYQSVYGSIPEDYRALLTVGILTLIIIVYALFTWKTAKSIAKRDLLSLDLHKYNRYSHPLARKGLALGLYFLEYLIILPFLITAWIVVFAVFLLLFNGSMTVFIATLISAAMIASVRILAYFNEEIAGTIAGLVPFNLLALSLVQINSVSLAGVISQMEQVYYVIPSAAYFFIFIIMIELIMRSFTLLANIDQIDPLDKD